MGNYLVGQRVQATVEQVLPFGVFVRLEDGTRAYIRRRELDLDADVDPAQVVREGAPIAAEVIRPDEPGKHLELSRRATLPDPWQDFARRFRQGDVVRGAVQRLMPYGVFVRLRAGIDGFIPLDELATWQVDKPEDVVWVGDDIEAVITHLEPRNKKITLSVKARMTQIDQAASILERLEEIRGVHALPEASSAVYAAPEVVDLHVREGIGKILVVDDDEKVRAGLVDWLERHGYVVVSDKLLSEAVARVQREDFGVLIVDLNLPDGDGLELVRQARISGSRAHVCVMSSPEWLSERAEKMQAIGVDQVFAKPLDVGEIELFLTNLTHDRSGSMMRYTARRQIPEETIKWREVLGSEHRTVPPERRLPIALETLTELVQAEKGVLFAADSSSHAISILAEAGASRLNLQAQYELELSPVKDVMVEAEPIFTAHATQEGRFRKLLDLVAFESCIGIPVQVMGETNDAVFFFHSQAQAFPRGRLHGAMIGAIWLSAILEAQALDLRVRSAGPLLLSGQLAASLAHEVYNRISALDIQLCNLLSQTNSSTDLSSSLGNLQTAVLDLKTVAESFQEMMRAKDVPTTFDINEAVRRTEALFRAQARHERAKVILRLAEDLPPVSGNGIALQQVFFNLMLNAVQQMALKAERLRWSGGRLLEISTRLDNQTGTIQVRLSDTGQGIHRQLWDKIFTPGFSTRSSSGLGLFISRSLVDSLGGKIVVEESFVPLGTTFLVELPLAGQGG